MASMGGMALVAAWRIPPTSLATDPSPNPTSRPPRQNPQYAHQQPKPSQTLSVTCHPRT